MNKLLRWWYQIFCRHNEVEVIRYHADVVPRRWSGKELYVDIHDVVNFVQCCKCKSILQGRQVEQLHSQQLTVN